MREWKQYKLGEIASFKTGKLNSNAAEVNGLYPFFTCSPETLRINNYAFDQEAVLLAGNNAEGNFNIKYYAGKFNAYQRTYIISGNEGVDNKFLYYALSICLKHFKSYSQGTATKFLTAVILNNFRIIIPESLFVQHRIASILSSLDDKIAVNKKICENLEAQAQALFKHWFVDFAPFKDGKFVESELGLIPEGWRVKRLGEMPLTVTDYVANGSFASLKENVKLYEDVNYAYFIRNTDLKSKNFCVYVDEHSYNFLYKSKLEGGEIIISNVGDVGSVHLCPHLDRPMTLGNNIIMVKPHNDIYRNFLFILFRWNYGQKLIQSIKGGSAQPKFNKTDFKSLKIIVPEESVLKKFDDIVSPLFNYIGKNDKENQELSKLRDTLLPKLMSGQIKL